MIQVHSYRVMRTLLLIFLVWVAVQILFTGRRVSESLALDSTLSPRTDSLDSQPNTQIETISNEVIVDTDLFGIKNQATAHKLPPTSVPKQHVVTTLSDRLNLVGTITGPSSIARAAILNKQDKLTKRYRIGEYIEGALIQEIYKDHVVLLIDDQRSILRRAHVLSDLPTIPKPKLTSSPIKVEKVPLPPPPPEHHTVVQDLLTRTKITPHRSNDDEDGLKINNLENVPLAKKLGLRDGDIIHVINGQKVKNRQKAYQVLRKTKGQSQLTIELTRNDQKKTLSFP